MIGREFTPQRFSCIMGMVIGAVGNSDISRAIARLKGDRSPFRSGRSAPDTPGKLAQMPPLKGEVARSAGGVLSAL